MIVRAALAASLAVFVVGCAGGDAATDASLQDRLDALGTHPCRGAFQCGALQVPLDRDDPTGEAIPLAFSVRPASGQEPSLGPLFIVDGGPGYSGIADTDDLAYLDPRLRERFDLTYFDLRGVVSSGDVDCPVATADLYFGGLRAASEAEGLDVSARAAAYSVACPVEAGWSRDRLAHVTSAEAAEDIESIRVAFGAPKITLYGLSYGTQLSQQYVAAHPESTRAVALDGVVDLTRPDLEYASDLSRATNRVLGSTFTACADDTACARELGDAARAYDALAAALEIAPASFSFPVPSGDVVERTFTRADLDTLTTLATDEQQGRMFMLRAIAAAVQRQDFVPIRRLLDSAGELDPATGRYATKDYSDAIYYTITCNDYGSPKAGSDGWIARGEADRVKYGLRSTADFYGDMPCTSWPSAPPQTRRPPAFAPPNVPVLLINAQGDVATPVDQGEAVAAGLEAASGDVRVVSVDGGHHVMWGSSTRCVDPIVNGFLVDPADATLARRTACDDGWMQPYLALGPVDLSQADALATARAVAVEILALPYFPYSERVGCDRGGTARTYEHIDLRGCSFFDGLVVDGTGHGSYGSTNLTLALDFSGIHTGSLKVTKRAEKVHVAGTFDGEDVDASD